MLLAGPLAARWRAAGWDAHEINGHDVPAIAAAANAPGAATGRPRVLVANTIFGKGVSFMERQIKWHYWPMSDDEFRQAIREIGAAA